jgi:hypothetical protein
MDSQHPLAYEAKQGLQVLHILNTTIIPWRDGLDFTVEGCEIGGADAVAAFNAAFRGAGVVSHVGHQSTADMLTTLLCGAGGDRIAMSRAPWDGEGFALVFQLKQRGEEGRIYTADELAGMGAGFRLMRINWSRQ